MIPDAPRNVPRVRGENPDAPRKEPNAPENRADGRRAEARGRKGRGRRWGGEARMEDRGWRMGLTGRQTDIGDIGWVERFGGVAFLGVEDDQPAPRLRLGRRVTSLCQGCGLAEQEAS
jgi:hypothetical protein